MNSFTQGAIVGLPPQWEGILQAESIKDIRPKTPVISNGIRTGPSFPSGEPLSTYDNLGRAVSTQHQLVVPNQVSQIQPHHRVQQNPRAQPAQPFINNQRNGTHSAGGHSLAYQEGPQQLQRQQQVFTNHMNLPQTNGLNPQHQLQRAMSSNYMQPQSIKSQPNHNNHFNGNPINSATNLLTNNGAGSSTSNNNLQVQQTYVNTNQTQAYGNLISNNNNKIPQVINQAQSNCFPPSVGSSSSIKNVDSNIDYKPEFRPDASLPNHNQPQAYSSYQQQQQQHHQQQQQQLPPQTLTSQQPHSSSYNGSSNLPSTSDGVREALELIVDHDDPTSKYINPTLIGEGSTSKVYLATEKALDRQVAIKKMNITKQQRRELLINEVATMKYYKHPNIYKMYNSYLVDDELWLVLEYLEGGALTDIVTSISMTEEQIATVCVQCLQVLAYLHSEGIIHRDIKSDSILLANDGSIKVTDFGFCAQVSAQVPRRKSLVGTPYWLSPEIISRQPYGPEADIWSMGIMIMEMVDGEPPFYDRPPIQAMKKIRDMPPAKLHNHARVSPYLDNFLSRMLIKDPSQRATARELLQHPFLQQARPPSSLHPLIARSTPSGNL